jgi:hypothetical protein
VKWQSGGAAQNELKEEDLPWTSVLLGTDNRALGQAGKSPTGLRKGSKVFGIPIDRGGQDFLIIGSHVAAGSGEPDTELKYDSDIPQAAKTEKGNQDGEQQPKYGDIRLLYQEWQEEKDGNAKDEDNQNQQEQKSIWEYGRDEGGPDRKPAKYKALEDSMGFQEPITYENDGNGQGAGV